MTDHEAPLIDLTLDGEFRRPPRVPWGSRIRVWAVLAALAASGLVLAALAFWLMVVMIPIAIITGLIAYGIIRFQFWRMNR